MNDVGHNKPNDDAKNAVEYRSAEPCEKTIQVGQVDQMLRVMM